MGVAVSKLGELREEFRREILGVAGRGSQRETRSDLASAVAKAEAVLGSETGKSAAPAIGIAIVAAGRVLQAFGGALRFLGRGGGF
jgi:hypothetical protein